jgi:hypothetical protein
MEMQIHLMTIAKSLRLRYIPSRPIELEADVNLRSRYDFIMYPEAKTVGTSGENGALSTRLLHADFINKN